MPHPTPNSCNLFLKVLNDLKDFKDFESLNADKSGRHDAMPAA